MNKYAALSPEEMEELFSNYLIDSWSYSAVSSFARNEKAFEQKYIYRETSRLSVSAMAGNAYHDALRLFFDNLQEGVETPLPELEQAAFEYIDSVKPGRWQTTKTMPTVEACRLEATRTATALLRNFYDERSIYIGEGILEVLGTETSFDEWLVVNGVDIPLPCHGVADLVMRLTDGRTVIVDHKSVRTYTDDQELAFVRGKQAIVYVLGFESKNPQTRVDEVWFIENKPSRNKDNSPQLRCHRIQMDHDTRRLYEALLYEPLKRMIEAVSDPDYVFTINDSDTLCNRADLYKFWTRTIVAELDDFPFIPEEKRDLIRRRRRKIRDASVAGVKPSVLRRFREEAAAFIPYDLTNTNMTNEERIEHTLRTFGQPSRVAHTLKGCSAVTYLLEPSAGVKIGTIQKYALDLAAALGVASVRVGNSLVVYEGRSYLPVETAAEEQHTLPWDAALLSGRALPLGRDNYGSLVTWDLDNQATPHMLICGATGSGKSVCIRSTIEYALNAGIRRIFIFDPKYEFLRYASVPGITVVNDIGEIEQKMKQLVEEMQQSARTGRTEHTLIVFDEFADAVAAARSGKELDIKETQLVGYYANGREKFETSVIGRDKSLEENLRILLQKGRSLGYRIVSATQRASTKVITGDAKVNFPVQVCFRVPKEVDSKVVLDAAGAETLRGHGDGLIRSPQYDDLVRFQGFFIA